MCTTKRILTLCLAFSILTLSSACSTSTFGGKDSITQAYQDPSMMRFTPYKRTIFSTNDF